MRRQQQIWKHTGRFTSDGCLAKLRGGMETRSNRLLVFLVVGTLLATLAVFAFWLMTAKSPDGQDFVIRFSDDVRGLKGGASVTYAGVRAGVVTDVRLDLQDPSVALVTVRLDPDIPILDGTKAEIVRSLLGDDATITIDGSVKGAAAITASTDGGLPVIPAKEGGLLGSGGDPMALIEKISRSVDNVSSNLDARGQQHTRERLAALSAASSAWPDRATRLSETLTGSRGRILSTGASIARAGERAGRIRAKLEARRDASLGIDDKLSSAQRAAEEFRGDVEALRPAVRALEGRSREVTESVRSARSTTQRLGDQASALIAKDSSCSGRQSCPITIQQNSRHHHRASASVSWYE